jgi:hypothetical protein
MRGTPRTSQREPNTPRRRSCDRSEGSSSPREILTASPDASEAADPLGPTGPLGRPLLAPPSPEERPVPDLPPPHDPRHGRPPAAGGGPSRLRPSGPCPEPTGALRPHRPLALRSSRPWADPTLPHAHPAQTDPPPCPEGPRRCRHRLPRPTVLWSTPGRTSPPDRENEGGAGHPSGPPLRLPLDPPPPLPAHRFAPVPPEERGHALRRPEGAPRLSDGGREAPRRLPRSGLLQLGGPLVVERRRGSPPRFPYASAPVRGRSGSGASVRTRRPTR